MDDIDRFLKKYQDDGFQFQTREVAWGKRCLGTKKPGSSTGLTGLLTSAIGTVHKLMIGVFESDPPTPAEFQSFLKDAEKFLDEARDNSKVDAIVVVTPSKLDKKPVSYLLDHSDQDVVNLLEYKSLGRKPSTEPALTQSASAPGPSVASATSVPSLLLDIRTIQEALPSRTEKERVLYAWEVFPEKALGPGQAIFVATQERGVLLRRVGSDHVTDASFLWEQVPGEARVEVDSGGPAFRIYDGNREHRLRHKDAEFIASLIHHLKWSREGFVTGHMKDLGFDPELVSRSAKDVAEQRYVEAVRNGFVLLENRIRRESMAKGTVGGKELVEHAFHNQTGTIPVGSDPGEREGVFFLFRGAFQAFRNPASHHSELETVGREEALAQLSLVNMLLSLTKKGKDQFERGI